jgi:seryl-tRNA synthetase
VIDVRLLRHDPESVRVALARRGTPELLQQLDAAIALDEQLRQITAERDGIRASVNEFSKKVGQARRDGDTELADRLQLESRSLGETEKALA